MWMKFMNHLVKKNKKVIGIFKIETPRNVWIHELVCLRSKMYAFESGDESKKKREGINNSYSKNITFEENKKCIDGEDYEKECHNYVLRSLNQEMYLQKIKKIFVIYV